MAFYDKFPYTNFQELNLDKIVKSIGDIDRTAEAAAESAASSAESAARALNYRADAQAAAEEAEEAASSAGESAEVISGALEQIALNTQQINANTAEISTVVARIDTIVPDGTQTEGNTELIDIRTGYNGIGYPSAGEAVRTQAQHAEMTQEINPNWISGYVNNTGNIQSDSTYTSYTTQLLPCVPGDKFHLSAQYLARHLSWIAHCFYNEDGALVGSRVTDLSSSNVQQFDVTITCDVANTRYIRISYRYWEDMFPTINHTYSYYEQAHIGGFMESVRNTPQNLYNMHVKGVINADGSIGAGDSFIEYTSDFIPVQANQEFFQHAITDLKGWMCFCTYDADREGIQRYTGMDNCVYRKDGFHSIMSFKVPAGVTYIRACTRTSGRQEFTLVQKGVNKASDAWIEKMKYYSGDVDFSLSKNSLLKSCSHRGMAQVAPENTLPAYRLARAAGFPYIETDVRFTSDHIPVMLHDETINRTARNADGTQIENETAIQDITFTEARQYDFGIFMGEKYAGTRIPSLDEALNAFRMLGVIPVLEVKAIATTSEMETVMDLLKKYNFYDSTVIQSYVNGNLNIVKTLDPAFPINKIGNSSNNIDDLLDLCVGFQTGQNSVGLNLERTSTSISEELGERCQELGLRLEIWTPNTYDDIKVLPRYVSAVYSDLVIASAVWANEQMKS